MFPTQICALFFEGKVYFPIRTLDGSYFDFAIVSYIDWDEVRKHHWFVVFDKDYTYAKAVIDGELVSLSHFIMKPPTGRRVWHNSTNRLDNTRQNLRVKVGDGTYILPEAA